MQRRVKTSCAEAIQWDGSLKGAQEILKVFGGIHLSIWLGPPVKLYGYTVEAKFSDYVVRGSHGQVFIESSRHPLLSTLRNEQ